MSLKYGAFWLNEDDNLEVIDQRYLPFIKRIVTISNTDETVKAIQNMTVRGAGVIGNVAAFGVYLACREVDGNLELLKTEAQMIRASRPTAVNLMWAVDRMLKVALTCKDNERTKILKKEAILISDEDLLRSQSIAKFGADAFIKIMQERDLKSLNILTHCNAGWLAIAGYGSALAPIYELHRRGVDVHVWVDETRPRNQGANLTAYELSQSGIKHTVIADNTGGYLMQQGLVDVCITGADRVSRRGDVANKIGTYLKALAAKANNIAFYVALPASTFDFDIVDGTREIEIEIRSEDEVKRIRGLDDEGKLIEIQIVPHESPALNYGFDVTPAELISGLITENGICEATQNAIEKMFL